MLHLLRNVPPRMGDRPIDVEGFVRLVREWRREPDTQFGTWTRRRPRRELELAGGSVYFVSGGWTVFRMPFVGIVRIETFAIEVAPMWRGAWAIVCEPELTMVESRRIHRLRGWRYLEPDQAPKDCDDGTGRERGETRTRTYDG